MGDNLINPWYYTHAEYEMIERNMVQIFSDLEKSNKRGDINNIITTTPEGKSALFDAYQEWQKGSELND